MEVNLVAVLIATVVQFVVSGIWYTPLFGSIWGRIHEFDKHSKADQKAMQQQMLPLLAVQLVASFVTSYVMAYFMKSLPGISWWQVAIVAWIGFVVTTQASAVLFGGTKSNWIVTKILIMAGGSLVSLLATAFIINAIG